jgi:hypothetical protein
MKMENAQKIMEDKMNFYGITDLKEHTISSSKIKNIILNILVKE